MTLVLAILLLIASVVDLRRREIPDWISLAVLLVAIWGAVDGVPPSNLSRLGGLLIAFQLGCVLYLLGGWGGGDVKLLGALGSVLGVAALFTALFWMALAGGVLACVAAARRQREFAYGPAIAFGALCAIPKADSWRLLVALAASSGLLH